MKRFVVLVTENNDEYEIRVCDGKQPSFLEESATFACHLKNTPVISKICGTCGIPISDAYEKLKENKCVN